MNCDLILHELLKMVNQPVNSDEPDAQKLLIHVLYKLFIFHVVLELRRVSATDQHLTKLKILRILIINDR